MCRLAFVSILFLGFCNNSFGMLIGDFDGLAIAVEKRHIDKKVVNGGLAVKGCTQKPSQSEVA